MATPTWITLANANQYNQVNTGTTVSSFTSLADVSPGLGSAGQAFQTTPAQLYPGQLWRFSANGIWSSTSSPGVSLGIFYGGAAAGTVGALCSACVAAANAFTNCASIPWYMQAVGRVTAVGPGTSSAWQTMGVLTGLQSPFATYTNLLSAGSAQTGTAGAGALATPMLPYTGGGVVDSSTAKVITLAAQCSASSGSNAVTVYNWAIEYMTEP